MPALPGRYDITARVGTRFRRELVYEDPDGNAVDLTGYTATLIARTSRSGRVIVELTSEPGDGITINAESGQIVLEIPATETDEWSSVHGVYDLNLNPADPAQAFTLLTGSFAVLPRVDLKGNQ